MISDLTRDPRFAGWVAGLPGTVTLVDGRQVASDSEDWRHEAEARAIAALPTLQERRAWLGDIERRRGKAAADALRATMRAIWAARPQGGGV